MGIWNSIIHVFNNREIALAFWLIVAFSIWVFKDRFDAIKSIFGLLKSFFGVIIMQISYWVYLSGVIVLLSYLGLWNTTMIKDSIIFLLISALVFMMKLVSERNGKRTLKEILADAVKPIILAEFITNLESFSLIGEIILLLWLVVAYFGSIQKGNPEEVKNAKIFGTLFNLTGFAVFVYGVYHLYSHYDVIDKRQTIRDFLFPVLSTIAFLPYLYCAIWFFKWEAERVRKKQRDLYK
jgi:hypothetical protein